MFMRPSLPALRDRDPQGFGHALCNQDIRHYGSAVAPARPSSDRKRDLFQMTNELRSIRIIIPWFGPWPAWMRCFIESCRWNPTVDWLLFSDAPPPDDLPPNLRIVTIGFADYRALVASRLGINLEWTDAHKLCDVKPALGFIHEPEIAGYDYWGYGDLDVIYGNIRHFFTPQVLTHDLVTTHEHIVAGHLTVLRTTPRMLTAFRRIPRWRAQLSTPRHRSFDKQVFSRLFLPIRGRRIWRRLITPYLGGGYFQEQFSTHIWPLKWIDGGTNYPQRWFWDRGRLTTDSSGDREFLYAHFTHWNSNRWVGNDVASWKTLDRLVSFRDERPTGFTISAKGFTPLHQTAPAEV
jgi:hypothetical protein